MKNFLYSQKHMLVGMINCESTWLGLSVVYPQAHTTTTCKNIRWAWQGKTLIKATKQQEHQYKITFHVFTKKLCNSVYFFTTPNTNMSQTGTRAPLVPYYIQGHSGGA